jgi:hypothetical protein
MIEPLFSMAMLAAMPLPPPGQIVKGFGTIPESRNGPIFSWRKERIAAVDWSCDMSVEDRKFRLVGRSEAIDVDPSNGPVPNWPPFGIVKVAADPNHPYDGTYIATYSRKIYGFRFAHEGDAYEVTLRFDSYDKPGIAEFRRFRPVLDREWSEIGRGTCAGRQQADESRPA